jgi:hypothetical protein
MPGLVNVRDIGRHRVPLAAERHQFKGRVRGSQCRHEG